MSAFYTGDSHAPDQHVESSTSFDSITKSFDRSAVMGDINVTPMVDVMLVLLIIFMVVTPALVAGFNAQLPVGANLKERPEEEQRTTLGIDGVGDYYLNTRPVPKCTGTSRATPAGEQECATEVSRLLQAEFAAHPQDRVLFVKADRGLKYQEILDVMRLAKNSGARVVAAVTEQRSGAGAEDEEESS
jgi:biopolymer transport protein ExbD